MTDQLPTARTMLRQDAWLCLLVWCKACHHQAPADLRSIIDSGRGDVPLKDLKFRCTKCGSALTDAVVMSRDACSRGAAMTLEQPGTFVGSGHGGMSRKERRPRRVWDPRSGRQLLAPRHATGWARLDHCSTASSCVSP